MKVVPRAVGEPAGYPVGLAQVRQHCRIDTREDDALLTGYIMAATERVESAINRALAPRPVQAVLDGWPGLCGYAGAGDWAGGVALLGGVLEGYPDGYWYRRSVAAIEIITPVQSVDAVSYTAVDGSIATWAPGAGGWIARRSQGGITRVRPASGVAWPVLGLDPVITLSATAGYAVVPGRLIQAVLMLVAHYYQNREDVVTGVRVAAIQLPQSVAELIAGDRWSVLG